MNRNKYFIFFSFLLTITISSISSCKYRNKEEFLNLKKDSICDTSTVTYMGSIIPILEKSCYRCHGTASNTGSGGIILQDYNVLKTFAADGRLYGNAAHLPGYIPMPYDGGKLSDCELLQIKNWVDNGYPNN